MSLRHGRRLSVGAALCITLLLAATSSGHAQESDRPELTGATPDDAAQQALSLRLFQMAERLRLGVGVGQPDLYGAMDAYKEASRGSGPGAADALCALAKFNEEGLNHVVERNLPEAVRLYNESAARGNASALLTMGVLHAYGLFGVPHSERLAVLHYYLAALGGNPLADLAMAYRHSNGVGAPKSCPSAAQYYNAALPNVLSYYNSRAGVVPSKRMQPLSDDAMETMGDSETLQEHQMDYYESQADADPNVFVLIGHLYYYGGRGLTQSFERAAEMYLKAEQRGVVSHGSLGTVYLRGLGVPRDASRARSYFESGVALGDPTSMNGLAHMHLHGDGGVEADAHKAALLFRRAADAGNVEAQYNLGMLRLKGLDGGAPDYRGALQSLTLAHNQGHLLATYSLSQMYFHGLGMEPQCAKAVDLMKSVATKGEWSQMYHRAVGNAMAGYTALALLDFFRLSEMGYPSAMSSAAYLLEEVYIPRAKEEHGKGAAAISAGSSLTSLSSVLSPLKEAATAAQADDASASASDGQTQPEAGGGDDGSNKGSTADSGSDNGWVSPVVAAEMRALKLYERLSSRDALALLRLGDYHYYGLAGLPAAPEAAITFYRRAGLEGRVSQAFFNLAYMHEYGLGVPRDLHLAKRYYDEAIAAHPPAYYPTLPCLLRVRFKLWMESTTSDDATSPTGASGKPTPHSQAPQAAAMQGHGVFDWLDVSRPLAAAAKACNMTPESFSLALAAGTLLCALYARAVRRARVEALHYQQLARTLREERLKLARGPQ